MKMRYKFLEHTADMKFQSFGKTLEEAFENSALAEFSIMYDGKVKPAKKKKISVHGKDFESLLYNFLEELLFLLDSENFFLSKIDKIKIKRISINKNKRKCNYELEAEVLGDDAENYEISLDVKAITYNEMFVRKEKIKGKDKWVCQVVVDV